MFIGEGPGADEDREGIPFVGKAGKLMNMAFEGIGIKREEVKNIGRKREKALARRAGMWYTVAGNHSGRGCSLW